MARDAEFFLSDGIIVTGGSTGLPADTNELKGGVIYCSHNPTLFYLPNNTHLKLLIRYREVLPTHSQRTCKNQYVRACVRMHARACVRSRVWVRVRVFS